ncbi:MAG: hypothetical protein KA184_22680, partial [Candidatus Hydrogenedentes bacterium]|nr:hypothetical protein [Candidatus Hydrogenedentota bacterium]
PSKTAPFSNTRIAFTRVLQCVPPQNPADSSRKPGPFSGLRPYRAIRPREENGAPVVLHHSGVFLKLP